MFLEADDDPYDIDVEMEEFCSVIEEAADDYRGFVEDYDVDRSDVEVEVSRNVDDRPERFIPLSTRLQGPLVIVEYELEYGRQTFRTRDWAEYRDRPREEALSEADRRTELPAYVTVEEG